MSVATRRNPQPTIRLRRRRIDGRLLLAVALLVGLLAASSVVSAAALRHLPLVWQVVIATAQGPQLPPPEAQASVDPSGRLDVFTNDDSTGASPSPDSVKSESAVGMRATDQAKRGFVLSPEDYVDNWLQAGTGENRLGTVKRSHQVRVGSSGKLRGRLVVLDQQELDEHPLKKVRVLILRRGVLAATVRTDGDGTFELNGLTGGTYAFLVATDDMLLAYGFHVIQDLDQGEKQDEPTEFRLNSPVITGDNVAAVLRQMVALSALGAADVEEIEPPEALIPQGVRAIWQEGELGTPLWTHRVRQQPSGHIIGRVHRLHPVSGRPLLPPLTQIALMQTGKVVTTARTDRQGVFATGIVKPGVYTVVATTLHEPTLDQRMVDNDADSPQHSVSLMTERPVRAGFAAFAIEVMPAVSLVNAESADPRQLTPSPAEPLEVDFALIEAADLLSLTHQVSSGRERTVTGNGTSRTPTGTRTAPTVAATGQSPTLNASSGGGGGGGLGSLLVPFAPGTGGGSGGEGGETLMSPAAL